MFDFLFDFFSTKEEINVETEKVTGSINEEVPIKKKGIRKTERKKRSRNATKRYRMP